MNAAADAALLARVTLSLTVVVLLAVLGARLARRTALRGHGRTLRVLERLPLSRDCFLAVVAIADRGLVLGVSAHGVRVVSELDADTVARVYPEPPAPAGGGGGARAGWSRGQGRGWGRGQGRGQGRERRPGEVAGVEVGPDGVKVTRLPDGADPATGRGTGAVLDPRTWRQAVQALRELTVRRGGPR